jgi:Skp family chaperone for outer membrane proteins
MPIKTTALAAAMAGLCLFAAPPCFAQTALPAALPAAKAPAQIAVALIDPARVYNDSIAGKNAQAQLKLVAAKSQAALEQRATTLKADKAPFEKLFEGKDDAQIKTMLDADPGLRMRWGAFMASSEAFMKDRAKMDQELTTRADSALKAVLDAAGPDVDAVVKAHNVKQVVTKRPAPTGAADLTSEVIGRFNARVKSVPLKP